MFHGLEIAGDKPHLTIFSVLLLESVAQLFIHSVEVFHFDAFTVGWVGHNQRFAFGRLLVGKVADVQHHVVVQLGIFEVLLALLNHLFINVVTPYFTIEIERANLAAAQFRNALHLFPLPPSKWSPEVLCYSGYYELGIKEVWDMIDRYFDHVNRNGYFMRKRSQQEKYWMFETINEQLLARFYFNRRYCSSAA